MAKYRSSMPFSMRCVLAFNLQRAWTMRLSLSTLNKGAQKSAREISPQINRAQESSCRV